MQTAIYCFALVASFAGGFWLATAAARHGQQTGLDNLIAAMRASAKAGKLDRGVMMEILIAARDRARGTEEAQP